MSDDGPPTARASDHNRLRRQVLAINTVLGDLQKRVFSLEAATADAKADLISPGEVDEALAEVLDDLLEDVSAAGR